MIIIKKEAIESLNKKLALPYTGIEQDWELEMADFKRVHEFIYFYKSNSFSYDEKIALMSLILASYDDFLNEKDLDYEKNWKDIKKLLKSELNTFSELLDYWGLYNENT